MRHFTQCFDANHRIIRLRLSGKVMQFVMRLQFNAEGVVLFIAQGWRQPTLGYACSLTPFFMTFGSEQNA